MGYVEATLAEGEHVVYRAKFHWLYTVMAWVWMILFIWILGLGIFIWLLLMVKKWTTEIAVTNRRVIYKRGWIARNTDELALSRIEEVNLRQGVIGRILGYGRLKIGGMGIGDITLPEIDEPLKFRAAINEAKGAWDRPIQSDRTEQILGGPD